MLVKLTTQLMFFSNGRKFFFFNVKMRKMMIGNGRGENAKKMETVT
jgi:hypothetical protein